QRLDGPQGAGARRVGAGVARVGVRVVADELGAAAAVVQGRDLPAETRRRGRRDVRYGREARQRAGRHRHQGRREPDPLELERAADARRHRRRVEPRGVAAPLHDLVHRSERDLVRLEPAGVDHHVLDGLLRAHAGHDLKVGLVLRAAPRRAQRREDVARDAPRAIRERRVDGARRERHARRVVVGAQRRVAVPRRGREDAPLQGAVRRAVVAFYEQRRADAAPE
ncbi:unnamed protein product, partial [Pelagomonas calceolata]